MLFLWVILVVGETYEIQTVMDCTAQREKFCSIRPLLIFQASAEDIQSVKADCQPELESSETGTVYTTSRATSHCLTTHWLRNLSPSVRADRLRPGPLTAIVRPSICSATHSRGGYMSNWLPISILQQCNMARVAPLCSPADILLP